MDRGKHTPSEANRVKTMNSKHHNRSADTRHDLGVTLIELIVVLGMMAIIAAMAVTSLSSEGSKLRAAAYNLRTELLSAKAEAIKKNHTAIINFNNTTNSYQASIDGNTLFRKSLPREVSLSYSNDEFKFTALSTAFPNNGKVTLSSAGKEYEVQINACGKVTIKHIK